MAAILGAGLAVTESRAAAPIVGDGNCLYGGDTTNPVLGTTAPDGNASNTLDCSGIFSSGMAVISGTIADIGSDPAPASPQETNEFILNSLAFYGTAGAGFANVKTWELAEEITNSGGIFNTTSDQNDFNLEITGYDGGAISGSYPTNGLWSVSDFGAATKAAIVLISETNEWGVYLLDMSLTSGAWSFSKNYTKIDGKAPALKSFQLYVTTEVPVPAALPMLLTGIAGLAVFKRRKRAA